MCACESCWIVGRSGLNLTQPFLTHHLINTPSHHTQIGYTGKGGMSLNGATVDECTTKEQLKMQAVKLIRVRR